MAMRRFSEKVRAVLMNSDAREMLDGHLDRLESKITYLRSNHENITAYVEVFRATMRDIKSADEAVTKALGRSVHS